MKQVICLKIPIKTISEGNFSEHWTKRHKRHQKQQYFVRLAFNEIKEKITLPCKVILTRCSNRMLDDDNLLFALKWIRDQCADCIIPGKPMGVADSDKRIKWEYKQEKSTLPLVKIEIFEEEILSQPENIYDELI